MTEPVTIEVSDDELPLFVCGTPNYGEVWTRDRRRFLRFTTGIVEAMDLAREIQDGRSPDDR